MSTASAREIMAVFSFSVFLVMMVLCGVPIVVALLISGLAALTYWILKA